MTKRASKIISWMVPQPIRGSGGHRTILAHVRDLVSRGYECRVYVPNAASEPGVALTDAEAAEVLRTYFFECGAKVVVGWDRVEPCDILFATAWESAYFVNTCTVAKHRAYFVQDFEAFFSPMGDGYLNAEHTYRLGLQCVTIGRWLTHLIGTQYGGTASHFDFTAALELYRPDVAPKSTRPRVCAIYQPEKPRRCPWIVREALGIVKHRVPEAEIVVYGADVDNKDWWFEHTNKRLVSPKQCAELYASSHVGLCVSSSNPSRVPFEMMAAGCAVVDVDLPNNRFDYEPGAITLAMPSPEGLAESIVRLLIDEEARQEQVRCGLRMMAQRPDARAFGQFAECVDRILSTGRVIQVGAVPASADDTRPSMPYMRSALERERLRRELAIARAELRRARAELAQMTAERDRYESIKACTKQLGLLVKRRVDRELRERL